MARRGENIYKRKDSRYEGRYIRGRQIDGKAIFGYVYGRTYAEVKQALTMAKASGGGDTSLCLIDGGNLEDYLNYWLEQVVKDRVKYSTYAQYQERVRSYILPALGNVAVANLSGAQVQCFVDSLKERSLASSTIRNIVGLLRMAMQKALSLHLTRGSPCNELILPPLETKELRVLDQLEQIRLEQQAESAEASIKIAVFLSLYTGLRIGELCALHWEDVDTAKGILTVRRTLQRVRHFEGTAKTSLVEGKPKSKRSQRQIPLPRQIADKLNQHRNGAPNAFYVLTNATNPLEPRAVRAKFKRLCTKAELSLPFHALRHSYATRCLELNFDIQALSELLGHANANVTMKVYAHSILEHKRQLTGRIHVLSERSEPSNEPSGIPAVS